MGLIDDPNSVVLDTYGSQNEKVRIGGGLRNPVADTMVLYDVPSDAIGLYSLGQLQHFQVSDYFDEGPVMRLVIRCSPRTLNPMKSSKRAPVWFHG